MTKIFAGGVGNVIGQVGGIIDQFKLSPEQKQKFKLEMESLLQKRDSEIEQTSRAELGAKEHFLVAELAQGDNYTKRARPTVVYAGLIPTLMCSRGSTGTKLPPLSGTDLPKSRSHW